MSSESSDASPSDNNGCTNREEVECERNRYVLRCPKRPLHSPIDDNKSISESDDDINSELLYKEEAQVAMALSLSSAELKKVFPEKIKNSDEDEKLDVLEPVPLESPLDTQHINKQQSNKLHNHNTKGSNRLSSRNSKPRRKNTARQSEANKKMKRNRKSDDDELDLAIALSLSMRKNPPPHETLIDLDSDLDAEHVDHHLHINANKHVEEHVKDNVEKHTQQEGQLLDAPQPLAPQPLAPDQVENASIAASQPMEPGCASPNTHTPHTHTPHTHTPHKHNADTATAQTHTARTPDSKHSQNTQHTERKVYEGEVDPLTPTDNDRSHGNTSYYHHIQNNTTTLNNSEMVSALMVCDNNPTQSIPHNNTTHNNTTHDNTTHNNSTHNNSTHNRGLSDEVMEVGSEHVEVIEDDNDCTVPGQLCSSAHTTNNVQGQEGGLDGNDSDLDFDIYESTDSPPTVLQGGGINISNGSSNSTVNQPIQSIKSFFVRTSSIEDETSVSVFHGKILEDRGSKFQAHAAKAKSLNDVNKVKRQLMRDPSIAKATHNILAYRVPTHANRQHQQQDVGYYLDIPYFDSHLIGS
eukprot:GHVR01089271.1.p1 GENE.GHVR01089271.1~~GHVR01089271.1.p1  ORF type:complete len:581 (+),score=139.13 GHVR01089271.1:47-1789(+)